MKQMSAQTYISQNLSLEENGKKILTYSIESGHMKLWKSFLLFEIKSNLIIRCVCFPVRFPPPIPEKAVSIMHMKYLFDKISRTVSAFFSSYGLLHL